MIRSGKQMPEVEIDPVDAEFTALGDHIRHLRMQVKALADACELVTSANSRLAMGSRSFMLTETDYQKIRAALTIAGRVKS